MTDLEVVELTREKGKEHPHKLFWVEYHGKMFFVNHHAMLIKSLVKDCPELEKGELWERHVILDFGSEEENYKRMFKVIMKYETETLQYFDEDEAVSCEICEKMWPKDSVRTVDDKTICQPCRIDKKRKSAAV